MLIPSEKILKRTLMLSLAGTRGGFARLNILLMLERKPSNINEIAKNLSIDYKTAQHHIRVLEKSGLIVSSGKKYGNNYELSALLKINKNMLKEISSNMGKSK